MAHSPAKERHPQWQMSPWLELLPEPHCCRAYVSSSSNWPTLDGIPCSSPQEAMKNTCMDCIDDICTVHTPLCSENAKYVQHNQWKADSCIFSPFERLDPGKGLKRWLCFYILWTWNSISKCLLPQRAYFVFSTLNTLYLGHSLKTTCLYFSSWSGFCRCPWCWNSILSHKNTLKYRSEILSL